MPELTWKSAGEQAEAVRKGELSPRELVEAALDAIERLNPELGAFVTVCGERALAEADSLDDLDDRPLAGVPFAIKDLGPMTAGVRTTFGMRALGDFTPRSDSALVRRLRGAGAILVGKTNTPELGLLPVTEPVRFGAARNPWDRSRTPGGSSGGSAAAVSSGMVALAHGNDGGGSIRVPASCCGLVGLKPSRGRVSLAPFGEYAGGLTVDGVLTRTVLDTAISLDVISGPEIGDPYWAAPPAEPFAESALRPPARLRVAFTTEAPNGAAVHADCVAAVHAAAEALEALGHELEEAAPPWRRDDYFESFLKVWGAGTGSTVRELGWLRGRPIDPAELEPLTRELADRAESTSAADYLATWDALRGISRTLVQFWETHDVVVTPTLAQPPIPIGSLEPPEGEPALSMLERAGELIAFTPIANVTGQPAISLPLHHSSEGLPIGVQCIGPPAGDALLLSLAGQLEQARPWAERRPEPVAA